MAESIKTELARNALAWDQDDAAWREFLRKMRSSRSNLDCNDVHWTLRLSEATARHEQPLNRSPRNATRGVMLTTQITCGGAGVTSPGRGHRGVETFSPGKPSIRTEDHFAPMGGRLALFFSVLLLESRQT
ncbi:hypothetical protein Bbelb_436290 [Branchiostoma belcheri]|nr:hypothetical protein Bbelb_436290 [Branchiostoma belcheri]